jgi:hypothetical protein
MLIVERLGLEIPYHSLCESTPCLHYVWLLFNSLHKKSNYTASEFIYLFVYICVFCKFLNFNSPLIA